MIHPTDGTAAASCSDRGRENDLLLAQYEMIERMAGRISELEALVGKPRKTSKNSHIPPSKDNFGKGGGNGRKSSPPYS